MSLTVEQMVERLATRGLVPQEHNLTIWQCVDGEKWGAAIETPYVKHECVAFGSTITEALVRLMTLTNRGADVQPTTHNPPPTTANPQPTDDGPKKTS